MTQMRNKSHTKEMKDGFLGGGGVGKKKVAREGYDAI